MRQLSERHRLLDGARVSRERVAELVASSSRHSAGAGLLARCLALCEDVESLRRYCALQKYACIKILKKHDKGSDLTLRQSLVAYVEMQPFHASTMLAELWAGVQALIGLAFAQLPLPFAGDGTCAACASSLRTACRLQCGHVLCGRCRLAQAEGAAEWCALCDDGSEGLSTEERILRAELQLQPPADASAPARAPSSGSSDLGPLRTLARCACANSTAMTNGTEPGAPRAPAGGGAAPCAQAAGVCALAQLGAAIHGASQPPAGQPPQPPAPAAPLLVPRLPAAGASAAAGAASCLPAQESSGAPAAGAGHQRLMKPGGVRKQACANCHRAKAACVNFPCERCGRLGMQCSFLVGASPRAPRRAPRRSARHPCCPRG